MASGARALLFLILLGSVDDLSGACWPWPHSSSQTVSLQAENEWYPWWQPQKHDLRFITKTRCENVVHMVLSSIAPWDLEHGVILQVDLKDDQNDRFTLLGNYWHIPPIGEPEGNSSKPNWPTGWDMLAGWLVSTDLKNVSQNGFIFPWDRGENKNIQYLKSPPCDSNHEELTKIPWYKSSWINPSQVGMKIKTYLTPPRRSTS